MHPVDLVLGALALDRFAFEALLAADATPLRTGTAVTFLAGLSIAIGQSVALFALQVSPRRFAASLLVQAVLFVASFFAWAVSVWWVSRVGFDAARPLRDVIAVVGLAHAPQLLGFLVLTPYFGTPLQNLLSAWTLVATLVGTAVLFSFDLQASVLVVAGGWLLTLLGQRTFGRPLVRLGRRVRLLAMGAESPSRPGPR